MQRHRWYLTATQGLDVSGGAGELSDILCFCDTRFPSKLHNLVVHSCVCVGACVRFGCSFNRETRFESSSVYREAKPPHAHATRASATVR